MPDPLPTITLAGKAWPIPRLTRREQQRARPILTELARAFAAMPLDNPERLAGLFVRPAIYERLIDVVHLALNAMHPMTRDEFEDMPITPVELIEALSVVSLQSGLMRRPRRVN